MPLQQVINVAELPKTRRVMRHPQHPFQLRTRPWQIAPFLIAPVLPGETLKSASLQARVVSDPIKNPLIGWHQEYAVFYVKHRDLDGRDDFTEMMLNPDKSLASYAHAALAEYYHSGAGISWVHECLKRVTDWYYRNGDETYATASIGNLPAADVFGPSRRTWMDSAINDTDRAVDADVSLDLDASGTTTVSEAEQAYIQWQLMRTQGMTNMTYEDYLASFGVRRQRIELHQPELIRYVRSWTYPTNHIDPTDGSPTSAVAWKVAESIDKDRFFSEPGFIFGVSVTRPKVYLSGQAGSVTALMTDLYSWLPAVLSDDVQASWKKIDAYSADVFGGNGTSTGNSDGVWVDLKDLLLYGEQFVNFAVTETDAGMVALPTAALQKKYPSATMADALFVTPATANLIRQDGIVSLHIAASMRDTSQRVS